MVKEIKQQQNNHYQDSYSKHSWYYYIDFLLKGFKMVKGSPYAQRRLNLFEYSLNERSAIKTIRVSSFYGDCVRFIGRKVNLIISPYSLRAAVSRMKSPINYAVANLPTCLGISTKKVMLSCPSKSYQGQAIEKPFDLRRGISPSPEVKRLFKLLGRRSLDFSNSLIIYSS